jgi:crotonobetainyl-CoA:carnitine CoA-transferase CaiB-like acyl-CoA transferase
LYAAQAISAALYARERGKGGQHIELSMMDAVVSFLWADSAANEVLLDADGSQLSSFVAGFRPLRFSDGWGIVTPTSDHDFAGMCRALDVDGYDDPRVATSRRAHDQPRRDGRDHREVLRARRVAQHGGRERALRRRARPVRDDPLAFRTSRRPARGRGRIVRAPRPSRCRADALAPPSRAVRRDPGVLDRQFPGARRAHRCNPHRLGLGARSRHAMRASSRSGNRARRQWYRRQALDTDGSQDFTGRATTLPAEAV